MENLRLLIMPIFLVSCLLCTATDARGESALHSAAPVAAHITKPSDVKFSEQLSPNAILSRLGAPPEAMKSYPRDMEVLSFEYSQPAGLLPPGAGTYDEKPACEKSAVRKVPVVYDSEELKYFDLLFYDYKISTESAKADRYPLPAAPYLEGDLYNPYRTPSRQQSLGRFFDIRCLPTRIHFPVIDGLRYREYREGDRAWDRDGK